ncbi:MAG: RluA family pseudouridine synthase [Erysipelotrichaceae bacterium]
MRELIVNENDSDQRVDKFLSKSLKNLPTSLMYKYIRNKKIKVNKQRCFISQRLQTGDTLQCYIAEEFFEGEVKLDFLQAKSDIDIVYEDENLLLVNKEAGLLCHSDEIDDHDTLIDRIKHYLYDQKSFDPASEQSFAPSLTNRLDRNTSGIVIAAKNAKTLRLINVLLKQHLIKKYYHCIVSGKMDKTSDRIVFYHQKQAGNIADIVETPQEGYKEVISAYRVLDYKQDVSLLEVDLQSGKSHQIRSTLAHLHHPLLGDVKYLGKKLGNYQLMLCACELVFPDEKALEHLSYLKNKHFILMDNPVDEYYKKLN